MYIDETYQEKMPFVILSAYIVNSKEWKDLNNKIKRIKTDFFREQSFNFKLIRTHKYNLRESLPWTSLSEGRKKEFNETFWDLVTKNKDSILASIINKEKMIISDKGLNFKLAYSFLLQRFQYFLEEHENETGFVIYDKAECSKEIMELSNYHKDFLEKDIKITDKGKEKIIYLKNIYENLMSDDDAKNNFLQISDMIGAAISGKYNFNKDEWFDKLKGSIRKSSEGKIEGYGIKVFP